MTATHQVFDQVAECLSAFLKKFKAGFLPVVEQLMPQVGLHPPIKPLISPFTTEEFDCPLNCSRASKTVCQAPNNKPFYH